MSGRLLQRWRALAGEGAEELGRTLIAAWSGPQRRYHDVSHLSALLDDAERRAALIEDAAFIGYAIWFHDAVYEPGRADNEALSAAWARAALGRLPELADRVGRVIEMTGRHEEGEAEGDAALFLDMDIAILGAPRAAYCAYAAGIRAEYPHIADAAFAAGRAAFLARRLERTRTFRTDAYESEFGLRARANMAWELEEVQSGRMVKG